MSSSGDISLRVFSRSMKSRSCCESGRTDAHQVAACGEVEKPADLVPSEHCTDLGLANCNLANDSTGLAIPYDGVHAGNAHTDESLIFLVCRWENAHAVGARANLEEGVAREAVAQV